MNTKRNTKRNRRLAIILCIMTLLQISGVTLAEEPPVDPLNPPAISEDLPTPTPTDDGGDDVLTTPDGDEGDDALTTPDGDDGDDALTTPDGDDGDDALTTPDEVDEDLDALTTPDGDGDDAFMTMSVMLTSSVSLPNDAVTANVNTADYTFNISTGTLTILRNDAMDTLEGRPKWQETQAGSKRIYPVMVKRIVFEDAVTAIPGFAFFSSEPDAKSNSVSDTEMQFWNLTEINFSSATTLQTIETYTFTNSIALTSINLPANLTKIDAFAFSGCIGLTNIVFPATLTTIEQDAFSGCVSLTSIDFPASLTSIGSVAFSGCIGLTSIVIPATLTTIGGSAFSGCIGLKSATINSTPATFALIENDYRDNGASMFNNCTALETVNFTAAGLTYIPYGILSGCTALSTVTFAANTKIENIGHYAFQDCAALRSIPLPDLTELVEIGDGAFSGTSLTTLDLTGCPKLNLIGISTFANCPNLTTITLPESKLNGEKTEYVPTKLTIYQEAFANNRKLVGVVMLPYNVSFELVPDYSGDTPLPNYFLGNDFVTGFAFHGETLPAHGEKTGTTGIGSLPFSDEDIWYLGAHHAILGDICDDPSCTDLDKCGGDLYALDGTLVEDLKIDLDAVDGILTFPGNPTTIDNTYAGDTKLQKVEIPASVQVIGDGAFAGCVNLSVVEIAEGSQLTHIGVSAFAGTAITMVEIPASVETIGDGAFAGCSSLRTVIIEEGSRLYSVGSGAFAGTGITTLVLAPPAGNPPLEIGSDAFADSKLTTLTIPANAQLRTTDNNKNPCLRPFTYAIFSGGPKNNPAAFNLGLYTCENLEKIIVLQNAPDTTPYENSYLFSHDDVLFGLGVDPSGYAAIAADAKNASVEYLETEWFKHASEKTPSFLYLIQFPPAKVVEGTYHIAEVVNKISNRDDLFTHWDYKPDFEQPLVIGSCAFFNANGLESVMIPDVTNRNDTITIGAYAFGSTGETSVKFIDFANPQGAKFKTPYHSVGSNPTFAHGVGDRNPLALFLPDNDDYDYVLTTADVPAIEFYGLANDDDEFGEPLMFGTPLRYDPAFDVADYPIKDRLMLSVYRAGPSHSWAVSVGINPYYRAKTSALEAYPPDNIYQYIPYRFVPQTSLLDNRGLVFSITSGSLPNGFRLVTGVPTQDVGVPDDLLPGTIYGTLYEDAATIRRYGDNGRITFTLNATNGAGFNASVVYSVQLVPAPTASDEKFDVWPADGDNADKYKPDGKTLSDPVEQSSFFSIPITADKYRTFANEAALKALSGDDFVSRINKKYLLFKGVYLNGRKLIEGVDFHSEQGSTIVTLTDQTIEGLPAGDYTLAVAFMRTDFTEATYGTEVNNDLEVITTNFTIVENASALGTLPGEIENPPTTIHPPDPGDSPNIYPFIPTNTGGSSENSPFTPPTDSVTPISDTSQAPSGGDDDAAPVVDDAPAPVAGGGAAAAPVDTAPTIVGIEALIDLPPMDADGNIIVDGDLRLHIDIPFEEYTGATTLDGQPLVHTATEGSTIIDIPYGSFDGFAAGIHTLEVVFDDAILSLSINILERAIDDATTDVPQTVAPVVEPLPTIDDTKGNSTMLIVIIISSVLVLGGICLAIVTFRRRAATAKH